MYVGHRSGERVPGTRLVAGLHLTSRLSIVTKSVTLTRFCDESRAWTIEVATVFINNTVPCLSSRAGLRELCTCIAVAVGRHVGVRSCRFRVGRRHRAGVWAAVARTVAVIVSSAAATAAHAAEADQ